jgi:hypothetical protein
LELGIVSTDVFFYNNVIPSGFEERTLDALFMCIFFEWTCIKKSGTPIGVNALSVVILKITFGAGCCIQSTIH